MAMGICCFMRGMGVLALAMMIGSGCRTTGELEAPGKVEPEQAGQGDSGYALLFELMGDEGNVSKLLVVKRESAELRTLVKAISETAGEAHKRLEMFGKADPGLNLKVNGLPAAENAARKSISKAKAKELLTDNGKDFELALLLTQNEALTYGEHLALTLGVKEGNAKRAEFLRKLAMDLGKLRLRVRGMLAGNSSQNQVNPAETAHERPRG